MTTFFMQPHLRSFTSRVFHHICIVPHLFFHDMSLVLLGNEDNCASACSGARFSRFGGIAELLFRGIAWVIIWQPLSVAGGNLLVELGHLEHPNWAPASIIQPCLHMLVVAGALFTYVGLASETLDFAFVHFDHVLGLGKPWSARRDATFVHPLVGGHGLLFGRIPPEGPQGVPNFPLRVL